MGFYVEVHCDVRREGRDPSAHLLSFCWTHRNDNPQGRSIVDAKAEAREQGWTIAPHNMAACPNCAGNIEPFSYPNEQDA